MTQTTPTQVDLARLFNAVTTALRQNQESLNAVDDYNHNHGDNMVENFQTITRAVRARKASPPADQLAYASEVLRQRAQSGSAQVYSEGLAQAADRLQGRQAVSVEDAILLVQTLLGGQPPEVPRDRTPQDLFSEMMGGAPAPQQAQPAGGDLMGSLLGSLLGGGQAARPSAGGQTAGGMDLNTLLTAGMAFYQARQQGMDPMQALVQAVMSGSQMQSSAHRAQSGQLVASTLLNAVGKMVSGSTRRRR